MSAKLLRRAAALALSCVLMPAAQARAWDLRAAADGPVPYRGIANLDAAGTPHGSMLYPGGGGFLVGLIAHGVILDATRTSQKQKLQDEADQVLHPFREQLAAFQVAELLQLAHRRMAEAAMRPPLPPGPTGSWTLAAQPAFGITPDRQALVLDNAIALFAPGETEKPAYSVVVRVVSTPRANADPVAMWSGPAEAGTVLKEESARLVAHSLELALRDSVRAAANPDAPFRTLRYAQGTAAKMERVQAVEVLCGRIVVRNLRGWLMSLPQPENAGAAPAGCDAAAWR